MTYLSNTRQLTIEWGHCDPAGIVFNSHYFEYFDFSTILLFEKALGMKKIVMMKTFDADMPLVDARAKFLLPAQFGDVVEITSQIAEFRRSSFSVQHRHHQSRQARGRRPGDAGVGRPRPGRPGEDEVEADPGRDRQSFQDRLIVQGIPGF